MWLHPFVFLDFAVVLFFLLLRSFRAIVTGWRTWSFSRKAPVRCCSYLGERYHWVIAMGERETLSRRRTRILLPLYATIM